MLDYSAYGYLKPAIVSKNREKVAEFIVYYSEEQYRNSLNSGDKTLIDHAFEKFDKEIFEQLLKWDYIDINRANKAGDSALSHVLELSHPESSLKILLSRNDFSVDVLLQHKDFNDKFDTFFEKLTKLAIPDEQQKQYLQQLLIAALNSKDLDAIEKLAAHPRIQDVIDEKVIAELITVTLEDTDYLSALYEHIPEKLINTTDNKGYTLLIAACRSKNQNQEDLEVVQQLCDKFSKSIDINAISKDVVPGTTALKSAFLKDNYKIAQSLISKGASLDFTIGVTVKDQQVRRTPFQVVCDEGRIEIANAIINAKQFSPNKEGSTGNSALYTAYSSSQGTFILPALLNRNLDDKFITFEDFSYTLSHCLNTIQTSQKQNEREAELNKLNLLLEHFLTCDRTLPLRDQEKLYFNVSEVNLDAIYELATTESTLKVAAQKALSNLIATRSIDPHKQVIIKKAGLIAYEVKNSLLEIAYNLKDPNLVLNLVLNPNFTVEGLGEERSLLPAFKLLTQDNVDKTLAAEAVSKLLEDEDLNVDEILALDNRELTILLSYGAEVINQELMKDLIIRACNMGDSEKIRTLTTSAKLHFKAKASELLGGDAVQKIVAIYKSSKLAIPPELVALIPASAINTQEEEFQTNLVIAATEKADIELLSKILESFSPELEKTNAQGKTALQVALEIQSSEPHIQVALQEIQQLLIKKGAKVTGTVEHIATKSTYWGLGTAKTTVEVSAFERACLTNNPDLAISIISALDFDPTSVGREEQSALALATITSTAILSSLLRLDLSKPFITFNDFRYVIDSSLERFHKGNGEVKEQELNRLLLLLQHCEHQHGKFKDDVPEEFIISERHNVVFDEIYRLSIKEGPNQELAQKVFKKFIDSKRVDPHKQVVVATSLLSTTRETLFNIALKENDVSSLVHLIENPHFKINPSTLGVTASKDLRKNLVNSEDFVFQKALHCIALQKERVFDGVDHQTLEEFWQNLCKDLIERDQDIKLKFLVENNYITPEFIEKLKINPITLYKSKNLQSLRFLLEKNAVDYVQARDSDGNNLLHIACAGGHENITNLLLKKQGIGELLNSPNAKGLTPLMYLCMFGRASEPQTLRILDAILNHSKFDMEKENAGIPKTYKSSHALLAYASGNIEIALKLIEHPKFANREETIVELLNIAARDGKIGVIEEIIKRYPDLYQTIQKEHKYDSPAFILFANNHFHALEKLITNEATDINHKDDKGCTLLSYAAAFGNLEVVNLLLAHKAEPNIVGISGSQPPLMQAYLTYRKLLENKEPVEGKEEKLAELQKVIIALAKHPKTDPNLTALGKNTNSNPLGTSLLRMVCENGDKEILGALLQNPKLDLNFGGMNRLGTERLTSPLAAAYENGKSDIVTLMLNHEEVVTREEGHKLNVNVRCENGELLDFRAYNDGKTGILELITHKKGYDVNKLKDTVDKSVGTKKSQDDKDFGNNLFMQMCMKGDIEEAYKLYISQPIVVTHKNRYEQTALMLACASGNEKAVEFLATFKSVKENFNINDVDAIGNTALLYAYATGNEKMVNMLIEEGANPQISNEKSQRNCLMAASNGGSLKLVTGLLDGKLYDINQKDKDGNTALHFATANCKKGEHKEIFEKLITAGADINAKNKEGMTPLMLAIGNNDIDKIKLLLSKSNLDINAKDKHGNTALHYACSLNNKEIVKMLLENIHIDVNVRNKNGLSAFMIAAVKANLEENPKKTEGLEEEQTSAKKISASTEYTRWKGDPEIMSLLIDYGADPLFGSYYKGLGEKLFADIAIAGVATVANNYFLSFNPVLHQVGKTAIAANLGYSVYKDVSSSVDNTMQTYLNKGTNRDKSVDLKDKLMIGTYHTNFFGIVSYDESLKSTLPNVTAYKNATEAIYFSNVTPPKGGEEIVEPNKRYLTNFNQLEGKAAHDLLTFRYVAIKDKLDNSWLMPWTRYSLNKVANQILEADTVLLGIYRREDKDIQKKTFEGLFQDSYLDLISPANRDKFIVAMLEGKVAAETIEQFNNIKAAIKNNDIIVSPHTRYLTEEFEKRFNQLQKEHTNPGMFRKLFGFAFGRKWNETLQSELTTLSGQDSLSKFNNLAVQKQQLDREIEMAINVKKVEDKNKKIEQPSIFEGMIKDAARLFGVPPETVVDKVSTVVSKGVGGVAGVGTYAIADPTGAAAAMNAAELLVKAAPTLLTTGVYAVGAAAVLGILYGGYKAAQKLSEAYQEANYVPETLEMALKDPKQYEYFVRYVEAIKKNPSLAGLHDIPDLEHIDVRHIMPLELTSTGLVATGLGAALFDPPILESLGHTALSTGEIGIALAGLGLLMATKTKSKVEHQDTAIYFEKKPPSKSQHQSSEYTL